MIRRPPRSTLDRSSAASDVYKRQELEAALGFANRVAARVVTRLGATAALPRRSELEAVSYTHLRAHETVLDLVCRLLLEKKKHSVITYM